MIERTFLGRALAAWRRFAAGLAAANALILLGSLYWLVFTPLGLWKRWLGEDLLDGAPDGESYWRPRAARAAEDYKRLF